MNKKCTFSEQKCQTDTVKTKDLCTFSEQIEIWNQIFDSEYEISCFGNIRHFKTHELKKQYINQGGYKHVSISGKCYAVHRLVGFAFIPNPCNKPMINHIDFNPQNNRVENLEWVTAKENCNHNRPRSEIKHEHQPSLLSNEFKERLKQLTYSYLFHKGFNTEF